MLYSTLTNWASMLGMATRTTRGRMGSVPRLFSSFMVVFSVSHTKIKGAAPPGSPLIIIRKKRFATPIFPFYTPARSKSGVYSSRAEVRSWV